MIKPMLACEADLNKIKFPAHVSAKIDGIRCIKTGGVLVSRTGKPIPNKYIQKRLEYLPDGVDGELLVGSSFAETSSAVMSVEGEPNFKYYIFDLISEDNYYERCKILDKIVEIAANSSGHMGLQDHYCTTYPISKVVFNLDSLMEFEERAVSLGYEGIMIRHLFSMYKNGRSNTTDQCLMKLKRFSDSEAQVIGKTALVDKNGVKKDMLGSFQLRDVNTNALFEVGTGFTKEERIEYWNNFESYKDKIVKYKFQKHGTINEVPRFPSFIGFRSKDDL